MPKLQAVLKKYAIALKLFSLFKKPILNDTT